MKKIYNCNARQAEKKWEMTWHNTEREKAHEHKKGHSSRPFLSHYKCLSTFFYIYFYLFMFVLAFCYESEMKFTKNVSGSCRINFHAFKLMIWVESEWREKEWKRSLPFNLNGLLDVIYLRWLQEIEGYSFKASFKDLLLSDWWTDWCLELSSIKRIIFWIQRTIFKFLFLIFNL